jgi:hypothetical protein
LENKKGLEALLASREYVRGYWWPVLWRFVPLIALAAAAMAAPALLSVSFLNLTAALFLNMLLSVLITPFIVAYIYVIYMGLKDIKAEITETPLAERRLLLFSSVLGALAVASLIFFALTS